MSSPLSLGDLFTLGQTAWTLYQACTQAGTQFAELGTLCSSISLAIRRCRPNEPSAFVRRGTIEKEDYEAIELLANRIEDSLQKVKQILGRYDGIDVPSLRNLHRRLVFGVFTVNDCNDLKKTMMGQVKSLTLLLQGISISIQDQSASLLSELVAEKQKGKNGNHADIDNIDDAAWSELVKELKLRNAEIEATLLSKPKTMRSLVVQKFKQLLSGPQETVQDLELEETVGIIDAAAPTSMGVYNPWGIDWFYPKLWSENCFRFITVDEALSDNSLLAHPSFQPHDIEREYSPEDKWLCPFLEGWSLNRTKAKRQGSLDDAFYFSFNNLACGVNKPPLTSRLYFWRNPLVPSDRTVQNFNSTLPYPSFGSNVQQQQQLWPPHSPWQPRNPSLSWARFTGRQRVENEKYIDVPSMGFSFMGRRDSNWNPWPGHLDLSDEVTALFVQSHFGNSGLPSHHSDETIDQSMPKDWVWKKDVSGQGRHIYSYLGSEDGVQMDTTVHPSRFFREDDKAPAKLPDGWHRRLDRDGYLFFVDENTHTATRLDPRFNRNINQKTGLPNGWSRVKVKDGTPRGNGQKGDHFISYYHTCIGKTLIGTKWASAILTKSLDFKDFLEKEPEHEKPIRINKAKARFSYLGILKESNPHPIEREHRERYYNIFREVAKEGNEQDPKMKYRITRGQAEARCRNSGLPSAVYIPILLKADENRDGIFTPPEFAKVLHDMRFALEAWQEKQTPRPPTQQEITSYDRVFDKHKSEDNLVISVDEAMRATKANYPKGLADFAQEMWNKMIENTDSEDMLDIVQFGQGMHRIRVELERRKDLAMVGGEPVDDEPPKYQSAGPQQAVMQQLAPADANSVQPSGLQTPEPATPDLKEAAPMQREKI